MSTQLPVSEQPVVSAGSEECSVEVPGQCPLAQG